MEETIGSRLSEVWLQLPDGTRLVAVSKYHSVDAISEAYRAGQRMFGESHVQELSQKVTVLPGDIAWHFIGHLQTNKVKYIVPYIAMIESVDSIRLLREIDRQAVKCGRTVDVLLELHIAQEESKYGFSLDDCRMFLETGEWRLMQGVRICGLMMMASNVDDIGQVAREFETAKDFFDEVKLRYFASESSFCERSWGMSHDFQTAVLHGSTMVRVGTRIFGER